MAAMTGALLYVEFATVVLSGDQRSFSATETGGVVDASAAADAARTYLTTLKDGTATLSWTMQDGAGTLLWIACLPQAAGSLRWGELGSYAGSPAHHVYAIVTERRKGMGYADVITADVSWQFSGTVVDGTFPT